jgi:hypothetical protein
MLIKAWTDAPSGMYSATAKNSSLFNFEADFF